MASVTLKQAHSLRLAISDQNLELLPDYEQRVAVLQDLQFIDVGSTVLLKGRVACEVCIAFCGGEELLPTLAQINSAHELVLTEVILDNVLGGYEPEEVVALLSSFIFQEKTDSEPFLTPRLEEVRNSFSLCLSIVEHTQSHRAETRSSQSPNASLRSRPRTEPTLQTMLVPIPSSNSVSLRSSTNGLVAWCAFAFGLVAHHR